jgi:hypothetical protein
MKRCRLCDIDLDTVNVIYHYSRFHDSKPTYDELDAEVRELEFIISDLRSQITQLQDLAVATQVLIGSVLRGSPGVR